MPDNFVASEFPMVIIPYKEYEKLLNAVSQLDSQARDISLLTARYDALFARYGEVLDKLREFLEYAQD